MIKKLTDLRNGKGNVLYSKALNKNAHVHFEVIVPLGDQSEKRDINYIMNGNSLFSSRFGHSTNLKQSK